MDQPESEGVRLVSFDGGDKRAVSQLLILDEFMRRVEWDTKSPKRILPCDYFHMMAGVGTGGIIVFLLAVLRMTIDEAIEEFLIIWDAVYTEGSIDQAARSAKLEDVIKVLLQRKGMAQDRLLYFEGGEDTCKAFFCAIAQSSLGVCEKFRTYKTRETSLNPTIVEAIRATCAIPSLFTPVTIKATGYRLNYVTGAYNFNNPAWETIKEACDHFKRWRPVACLLSLGCGQLTFRVIELTTEQRVSDEIDAVASDCELVNGDLSWRIGKSGVYHRLSVDGICQTSSQEDILPCTKLYLARQSTTERMDDCVKAAQRLGRKTLREIAGVTEAHMAATHSLPPLSAFFLERPALIKRMSECLFRIGPQTQRKMVLSGLGGVGKTQITISFLLHYLPRFRHVLFIDATSVDTIEGSLRSKVKSLGETYSRTTTRDALEVLEKADHHVTTDWVIVYDNLDDESIQIAEYFPQCNFGTIIITTRNRHLRLLAPTAHLELDLMSEEESIKVLLQTSFAAHSPTIVEHQPGFSFALSPTERDKQYAREIVKELGYLPVALVQAGYYINVHNCLDTYLQLLKKRRLETLCCAARGQLDMHHHGVYATLEVTLPRLSCRARNLLCILGCVNHTGFPVTLFYRAALCDFLFEPVELMDRPAQYQQTIGLLRDTFRPRRDWDEQDVNELLDDLEKYYLITRVTVFMVQTLRVHPMVHSWIQDRILNANSADHEVYQAASVRLQVCGSSLEDEDISEFIYPHAKMISDRLDDLHVNDRAGLAVIYAREGDNKAIELWEGIHRDVDAAYGPEDLRTSESKLRLAHSYRGLSDHVKLLKAQIFEREVIEFRTCGLGRDHPVTIKAVEQWAGTLIECERYRDEGMEIQRKALAFWESRLDDNLEMILQAKRALACTLLMQDSDVAMSEAIEILTEVMQARVTQNGPAHHATLNATVDLAHACSLLGEGAMNSVVPPAIELWISIVDSRTKRRGIQHTKTLDSMENLAWLYRCHHMFEMSVERWNQVICLRKEAQGPNHKQTIRSMEILAFIYADYKRYPEAEILLKDIMAMRKEAQPPNIKDTLRAMEALAQLYQLSDQHAKLEEQWKVIIALLIEARGPNYECTIDAMEALAYSYSQSRKFDESEAQWKEAINRRKAAQGPDHGKLISAMAGLAELYSQSERYVHAEELWTEVIALMQESPVSGHKNITDAMAGLAATCAKCGKHEEAKMRWEEVIALRKQILGATHEDTRSAIAQLAIVYGGRMQYDRAEAFWKEAIGGGYTLWTVKEGTANNLAGLAEMYTQSHQYGKSLEIWDIAVNLKAAFRGRNHPNTLCFLAELANAYARCERYADAEAQWQEVIGLTKDVYGPKHRDTLKAMEGLAEMYTDCAEFVKAQAQWEFVVALWTEEQGPFHGDTIHSMERLSEIYGRVEWSGKGEALCRELITVKGKVQGQAHEETIDKIAELARRYSYVQRYDEAEVQWKLAIELSEATHGFSHEKTLEFMGGLASTYWECKRYNEAETKWRSLISRRTSSQGVDRQTALDIMGRLANMLAGCNWLLEAETRWKEAISTADSSQEIRHQDAINSMRQFASMYASLKQHSQAGARWEEGIEEILTARNLSIKQELDAMIQVALIFMSCKWFGAVETLGKEMVYMWRRMRKHEKPYALYTMERLAIVYDECGQHDEARKWYRRSRPCTCSQHHGDGTQDSSSHNKTITQDSSSKATVLMARIGNSGNLATKSSLFRAYPIRRVDPQHPRNYRWNNSMSGAPVTSPFEDLRRGTSDPTHLLPPAPEPAAINTTFLTMTLVATFSLAARAKFPYYRIV